ncbi:Hypothetical protein PHPALM_15364 [Phytophthora palmivora]|uniref:Uncharacterized protein n=1 Tax=Phytophthora palmivora TaxID=4796 RepID=A0A2P4XSE0_9STRA|nr:Hypothetical protein PHPALM_15364 [Phytophthora palmivora]
MSLAAFVPTNTQKARNTAVAAFKRMLEEAKVSLEFVEASILLDASVKRLAATMDRFGFYLATNEGYVQKQHVSVSADGTFYLQLLRVKTSEELALATQDAPCAALLVQLPDLVAEVTAPLDEGAPLQELLELNPPRSTSLCNTPAVPPPEICPDTQETPQAQAEGRTGEVERGEDSVQAYVNTMLKRVAESAGATPELTSHSFRRGGAQHANGDDRLAAQWIFDRDAWNMAKTNKAFTYITNTAREDRKVARVLKFLFNSCTGLKQQCLNVSTKVLSVLTAYLIRYYPQLKELSSTAPIVTHVEERLRAADIPVGDMHAWSDALDNERVWDCSDRQNKSESRHVIAFMKIFLEDGFTLVPTAGDYKDQVLDAGHRAKDAVLSFLNSQNINVKGAGSVLRALRPLHKSGILNERIAAHMRLLAIGSTTDPASANTQDIFNVVGRV